MMGVRARAHPPTERSFTLDLRVRLLEFLLPVRSLTIMHNFWIFFLGLFPPQILRSLFIYLLFKQVMPAVVNAMKEEAGLVTLVKPQFEARRSQVRNSYYFSIILCIFNLSCTCTRVFTSCSHMKLV